MFGNPAKPDAPGGAFIETEIWRKFVPELDSQTTEEDTIGVLMDSCILKVDNYFPQRMLMKALLV